MKPQPKRNGFATFSLVLAIAALASTLTMTIVIPIFLAILSIMFGLLSRGNTSMSNHALAGVIVACSALLINIAVGGFSFFIVFFQKNNYRPFCYLRLSFSESKKHSRR